MDSLIITAVNETLSQICWKLELKENWHFVGEELDYENFLCVCFLQKDQLISSDVPVRQWSLHRPLKDHLSRLGPHLQQELHPATLLLDLLIVNFDQNWAEFDAFFKEAGGDDFVEFVEGHMVGDLLHVLLGRVALALFQAVPLVSRLDASQKFLPVQRRVVFGHQGCVSLEKGSLLLLLILKLEVCCGVRDNCRMLVRIRVDFVGVVVVH